MPTATTRKFTRHDAAAIRRATRAYMSQPVIVETGTRHDPAGVLTADSTRWDDETSDLHETVTLDCIHGDDIAAGYTLDLYVYERSTWCNDHGDLITNLDARWDGTAWVVVDPFRPTYTQSATPTR
jgi:hypothetical protein